MRIVTTPKIILALASAYLGAGGTGLAAGEETALKPSYEQARELAFNGEREQSRRVCRQILEEKPDAHEVRVLLGRTLAWDRQHDRAREEFAYVLERRPQYIDARRAAIDLELWADRPDNALFLSNEGLSHHPDNRDFLLRKVKALTKLEEDDEAVRAVRILLDQDPQDSEARVLLERLRPSRRRAAFKYGFEHIAGLSEPWQDWSAEVSQKTDFGSVYGRLNLTDRFGRRSAQYEMDAYPKLPGRMYLYTNFAYSPHGLFPRFRYGAELFKNFPKGLEASGGIRYLDFDSSQVKIFTASIAKYYGSYWISFRPYLTPKRDGGMSRSYNLTVRRYLGEADHFWAVTFGKGSSPQDLQTTEDLSRKNSYKVRVDGKRPLSGRLRLRWSVGYQFEELNRDRQRNRIAANIGLEYDF